MESTLSILIERMGIAVVLVPEATGWVSQGGSRHRFLFLLDQDRLLLRWRLWACGQRSGVVQPPASVPGDHVHSRFAATAPDPPWASGRPAPGGDGDRCR